MKENYCATWASSQYLTEDFNMPRLNLSNKSLRQIVHTSIGGDKIRVRFSNRVGDSELTIKKADIAVSESQGSGKIIKDTDKVLTFGNTESVTIKPGEEVYSDPLDFSFPPLTELSVTIHFGKVPSKLTGHPGSRTFSFPAKGNKTCKKSITRFYKTAHWYVLAGIEVCSALENKAVICFGDSITDGRGSTDDLQNRWTDNLSRIIQKSDFLENKPAVINQGIGGTCVLIQGVERFKRDVLEQKGAAFIVLLYGVNDIIYLNADDSKIIECYKNMIAEAHRNNLKIYGATILPFKNFGDYTLEREIVRKKVNAWIKDNAGKTEGFDAYIDFESYMKDPLNPDCLKKEFDCGDGLHPSAKGYEQMPKAFTDLSLFKWQA